MDGCGKRILVVDENVGRRALLDVQLEREGYAVQSACDGVAGAEEIRKRRFDAVIADSHMQGFNGIEFAECCKVAWPVTPIILFSSDLYQVTDNADEVDGATRIGKPYEAAMLLRVLHAATQSVSTEQATSPISR